MIKHSPFSDQQRMAAVCQAAIGIAVVDVCATLGISRRTFHRWKPQLNDRRTLDTSQVPALQEENRLLRRHVAAAAAEIERLPKRLNGH